MEIRSLRTIVAAILQKDGRVDLAELIQSSDINISNADVRNWNDGRGDMYYWDVMMAAPLLGFLRIKNDLDECRAIVLQAFQTAVLSLPNEHIQSVTIAPVAGDRSNGLLQARADSEVDLKQIWPRDMFRVFISHTAEYKKKVAQLKDQLGYLGAEGFVAHLDIKPAKVWEAEIERALRSMQALVALLTPDFNNSEWTGHEVGWALGAGRIVVPVELGSKPRGLINKIQVVQGNLEQPKELAAAVVHSLLSTPNKLQLIDSMVRTFVNAPNFMTSQALCPMFIDLKDALDVKQKSAIRNAGKSNDQVGNAHRVFQRIEDAFGKSDQDAWNLTGDT